MCAAIIHIFNIKKKQNKLKPIYLKFNLRKTCCCQQVTRRQVHKWLSRICPAANEQFNNIVRFQQAGRGVVFHIFLRFLFWPLNFYFFLDFFFFFGRWKTGHTRVPFSVVGTFKRRRFVRFSHSSWTMFLKVNWIEFKWNRKKIQIKS